MMHSDLELLPSELAAQSVSPNEIVLPYAAALHAVDYLADRGVSILGWEAWERRPDGTLTHEPNTLGTYDLGRLTPHEAADVCHQTMTEAAEADLGPGTDELLFCITVRTT